MARRVGWYFQTPESLKVFISYLASHRCNNLIQAVSVISNEICAWTQGIILAMPNKVSRPKGGLLTDAVKGNQLTSPMGDVSADEGLLPPPVQQTGAFQQEGRGQYVTRYCRQDIHCSTHLCLLEIHKPNTAINLQMLSRDSMAITSSK